MNTTPRFDLGVVPDYPRNSVHRSASSIVNYLSMTHPRSDEHAPSLPLRIEQLGVVTSTQDLMKARLAEGRRVHGLVLRAEVQTFGRGRGARAWRSGEGGSYQTLAVYAPDYLPAHLLEGKHLSPRVSVAVAVGLAQTLPRYGVKVGIKWPNDLFYRRKKLAGILLDYTRAHLLIGVGMNVNNEPPAGAVGLRGWDLAGVHAVVLEGIQVGLGLFSAPAFAAAYAPYDLLAEQEVSVLHRSEVTTGVALGVSERGCLRLNVPGAVEGLEVCQGHLERFTLRKD